MSVSAEDRTCLAKNIYFEARDQSHIGQMAVAQVVLNRVEDPRFPDNICHVVEQQGFYDPPDAPIRLHGCQFSWFCDGKSDAPTDETAWYTARTQAAYSYHLHRMGYDLTEGSTHYHSVGVQPDWINDMDRKTRIDSHIFYRWD